MKKTIFLLLLNTVLYSNIFSQGYIKIYSDLPEETSQFIVYLNEEAQDAYPSDETEIENLLPGKYTLTVSFNADTIADWTKNLKLKKNQRLIYKVTKVNEFSKDAQELGRNIAKKDDNGLVVYYKLVQVKEDKD